MSNIIPGSGGGSTFDGGTITDPLIAPFIETDAFQVNRSGIVSTSQTLTFANSWVFISGSPTVTLPVITASDDGRDFWMFHDSVGTATVAAGASTAIHQGVNVALGNITLTNGESVHLKAYYTGSTNYFLVVSRMYTANFGVSGTMNANLFQGPTHLAQGGSGGLIGSYGPNTTTSGRFRLSNSTESKYVDIFTNGVFANTGTTIYIEDPGAATGYLRINKSAGVIDLPPVTAPASPATGWVIYTDTADGKLKAKNSAGTVRELAIP